MVSVVLFEPEIPQNTGNILRLCVNANVSLCLIEPLGFELSDHALRRVGMDYVKHACLRVYKNWYHFLRDQRPLSILAFTTKTDDIYWNAKAVSQQTFLLFGSESKGLPVKLRTASSIIIPVTIPMADVSRSINLSNTVAIGVYEMKRQLSLSE